MILAAALLATVVSAPPPAATLRVGDVCRPADDTRVSAPIADEKRAVHKLTPATSDRARNVAVAIELRCGANAWTWMLSQLPWQALELVHPATACSLELRADGYRTVEKELADANLGVVHLHRLPVIAGTVTDAVTRAPIARAEVSTPDGKLLATTDDAGRFRYAVDGPWPTLLHVDAAGRATRTISVPKAVADTDFPVALSRGGSVVLTLAPPLGEKAVRWEARRIIDDQKDEKVRAGEAAAGETALTIDGLDPGKYRIVLLGDGPLQRFAVPVDIIEGVKDELTLQIEPAKLELEVVRGDQPFAGAEIELIFRTGWRANLKSDDSGMVAEEIWQRGEYMAGIGLWHETRRLDGDERIAWRLNVPDRIIRGRVVDAGTNRPLAKALVTLRTKTADGSSTMSGARTGDDGTYEFKTVPAGTYSVSARVQGYQELSTPDASLADETHLETRDLRLQPTTGHILRVVSANGVPLAGAVVWVSSRNGDRRVGVTRENGRIVLPLALDEHGQAFVIPRSGSFAVTRFASMAEAGVEELTVTVPDGTASLEMVTQSTDGEPIANVVFAMRINGVALPGLIYESMVHTQGAPLWSDAGGRVLLSRMPPGRYEVWPITSPADRRAVESPAPPPAPVNVMLTPGHHVARLTFRPKAS